MTEMMGSPLNIGTAENISLPVAVPSGPPARNPLGSSPGLAADPYFPVLDDANVDDRTNDGSSNGLEAAFRKTGEISARVRNQALKFKNQQPLQLLAIIGGTALTFGVITRIWRSR